MKVKESKVYHILFPLCWMAYFTAYLGRLNYGAAITEIVAAEGFSNSACGLVSTGFFVCYGIGQLFSGIIGDRVSPKWMIFSGLVASMLCNLGMGMVNTPTAMLVVWCLNGIAQSMTWAPILRAFVQYLPPEPRKKACVNISTTYPIGTLATYIFCAVVVWLSGWRTVFFITSGVMLVTATVWLFGFGYIERNRDSLCSEMPTPVDGALIAPAMPLGRSVILLLGCIGAALAMQGMLRDGVMTWIPTYLNSTFAIGTTFSIFATTVLPIVNLCGVYLANFISIKLHKNELETAMLLFVVGGISALLLACFGSGNLWFSVAAFAAVTSCMTGTNVFLVHIIPTFFVEYGRVSTVSGVLNATVYIGSSIATFGIGAVADAFGWGTLLIILCLAAAAGALICFFTAPAWQRFTDRR